MVHVSFDVVSEFIPRVPQNRISGEDAVTKRICVAPDILSALRALPRAGDTIQTMLTLNMPVVIHAYYLESEHYLYTNEIKDLVPDAEITGEMWILQRPVAVRRVDYEIQNVEITERLDQHDKQFYYLLGGRLKRTKFQDNWENLFLLFGSSKKHAEEFKSRIEFAPMIKAVGPELQSVITNSNKLKIKRGVNMKSGRSHGHGS